jgi:predicted MFS family arabinose efflux permease
MAMAYPKVYYIMIIIGLALITGGGLSRSFLPLLGRELDPSGLLVGFAMSSYHFIRTFLELPAGFISDRVGRRFPVVVGLGLSTVGAVICGFSTSIYHLILGRTVWGFGAALYFTNNLALVIDLFEPRIRGKALGNLHGIEMIGSLIGQPAGAFLADVIGFRNVFFFSAGSIALSFLFAFTSKEFKEADVTGVRRDTSLLESLRGVTNRGLFFASLVRMLRMIITMGVIMTAFPIFLNDNLGLTVTLIGVAMTFRTVAFMISTFSGGYVMARLGSKRAAIVGVVLEASTLLLYPLITAPTLVFLLVFIGGFGSGLFQLSLALLMSVQIDEQFIGSGVGIYRTFQDAGSVIGPIVVMLLAESTGIGSTFTFGLIAYLVSIPLILLTKAK